jgi:hypothetical protein
MAAREYDPIYSPPTQRLFSLNDEMLEALDIDWTKPAVLRDRLRRIDRLIYLHGMYERNSRLITSYRKKLVAALPKEEPFPQRHLDWGNKPEEEGEY